MYIRRASRRIVRIALPRTARPPGMYVCLYIYMMYRCIDVYMYIIYKYIYVYT